jgi:hypothetical protein
MTNTIKIKTTIFSILFLFAFTAQAQPTQPTLSAVFTPNIIGPGANSRLTFTITNASASPVTGLSFTDVLPTVPGNMNISTPANVMTDCGFDVGGGVTAPNGGGTIVLTDAKLGGSQSCTIQVSVTASTAGSRTNPAITLSSSAGSSMSLPVDFTVVTTLPGFSKSFVPSTVALGAKSTLTFTIDNSANAAQIGNLDFTDNLPSGMVVASPSNVNTDCISAILLDTTITAVSGSSQIILDANGSNFFPGAEVLPIGATCTVTVDVLTTGTGSLTNQTSSLLADFVSAGFAVDDLEVTSSELNITKAFIADPVPPGAMVELNFTLTNRNRNFTATGVSFADDLTSVLTGLIFDSLISNDCGGSVTGVGGTTIGLSGGTISSQGSCTVAVNLLVPAAATPGAYTNVTGSINAIIDGSPVTGNMASDTLFVEPVPILTKEFLAVGTLTADPIVNPGDDVVIRFTLNNTSTTSMATDLAFQDELTDGGLNTGFLPFPVNAMFSATACGGSVALVSAGQDRQAVLLTGGSLAVSPGAGSSCTFDVTVTIPNDMPAGFYTNTTGAVTATVDGATRTGNPASDTLAVIAAPSLSKSFTDDPVAPGGTVTLEFTLNHSFNATTDATNITFTDDLTGVLVGLTAVGLPLTNICGAGSQISGTTILSLTGGNLAPGASCTFSVTLNVPAMTVPGNYTNTTSSVSADVMGQAATSASASDVLKVAGVRFTKEFLGGPVIAGDNVILRFTIENIHPTDDANITFFTDNLNGVISGLAATGPASVNTCGGTLSGTTFLIYVGGSIVSGATCTIEVPILVPLGTADGNYPNVTSVLSIDQGGAAVIDPATDTLQVQSNLLQLTKQFTNDPVAAGDAVTLEFTLSNLDATRAASSISFTDDLATVIPGFIFDSVISDGCSATITGMTSSIINVSNVSLAGGASCVIQISSTVPAATASAIYTNTTSQVTGMIGGFNVFGDAATDDLEVIELLLFSMAFDGPATATGSASLTFTITNPGANLVENISFIDDLNAVIPGLIATSLPAVPCGMTSSLNGISLLTFAGGSIPAMGGTCNFSVDVLVPASATAGSFPNTTSNLTAFGLKYADPATANLLIEAAPVFTKSFTPSSVGVGQTSVLSFVIDNTASTVIASNLSFTDTFPAGLVVDTTPAVNNTCAGTVTAIAGSGSITLSGGSVSAGSSCTLQVTTMANVAGMLVNTTTDLTSSSGNSGTASDTLTVNAQLLFSKSFTPNSILIGDTSTLQFTIDNTAGTVAASSLDFTDNLPAGMVLASPVVASTTCTGGTLTALNAASTISYTGGTVNAMANCTVSVNVVTTGSGSFVNLSGDLTSNLGNSGQATDTLIVSGVPTLTKSFVSGSVLAGGLVELMFTINNNATIPATNINFTDDLNAFVVGSTATNLPQTNTCGVASNLTGTNIIALTNGSLAANTSCQFSVMVSIPMTTASASYVNVTSPLSADLNGSTVTGAAGSEASASLMVILIPVVVPILNNWYWLLILLTAFMFVSIKYSRNKQ